MPGKLPDDFPHRQELVDAGYDTYGKVRNLVSKGDDWYKEVPGIGEKKALAAKPQTEDEGE
jgi:hypothetical protein